MSWAQDAALRKVRAEEEERSTRDWTVRSQDILREEFPGLRDRLINRIRKDVAEFEKITEQGIRSSAIAGNLEVVKESFPKFTIRIAQSGTAMRLNVITTRTKHFATDSEEEEQEVRFSIDSNGVPHYLWEGSAIGVDNLVKKILGPFFLV
jgi:hypothetical protein